jgi:hypothetical protein
MTTTSKQTNNIKNGLVGSTVSSTYGAIPGAGNVYTTNGTSGQFLTSVSNGTSWANSSTNFTSSNHKTIMTIPHGEEKVVLEKSATLEVKGNVIINGVDLEERLNTIEKVLQIPERDVKLEKKHPKLKKLYDEYIQALGKYRTFEAIKGEDDVS